MNRMKTTALLLLYLFISIMVTAQISPGDLAKVHAHLEGIGNCTKCHTLGDKVSNEKCLDCHTFIKKRLDANKGYHASAEVKGKDCFICHNDHHGRNFEIIRFDPDTFNHQLSGYDLLGKHAEQNCKDCHKQDYIKDPELREKDFTYLGLEQQCLRCHEDYHRGELSNDCASCHDYEAFRPASGFDHDETAFRLKGKHREVKCVECHELTSINGKEYQKFSGITHGTCADCHEDVHNNRFGQNCARCHSEESFHMIKNLGNFDHSRTDYPLQGKHRMVDCRACHKENYSDPLAFGKCMDCHDNYHGGELVMEENGRDCEDCHSLQGFEEFVYSIEDHNQSAFKLEGAHLATPCFACHRQEGREKWLYASLGEECKDCHEDIHASYISKEFYPEGDCRNCHEVSRWSEISFDHGQTDFDLEGAHSEQSCRACHFSLNNSRKIQRFKNLGTHCLECHEDAHHGQFDEKGNTDCERCHAFEDWSAEKFNHDSTNFPLDGKHREVACSGCHKEVKKDDIVYVQYKIKDYRCEACH